MKLLLRLVGLGLVLTAAPALAQPSPLLSEPLEAPSSSAQHVLTGDVLRRAGVHRLADVFYLLDEAALATTDAFTVDAHLGLLSPLGGTAPLVLLDGHRLASVPHAPLPLDLLPVNVDEVAYVEVWTEPTLQAGYYAPHGLIHIHTQRPTERVVGAVEAWAGNGINDPGPFQYVERGTRNAEHEGPDLRVSLAAARQPWYAGGTVTRRVQGVTDPRIDQRIKRAFRGYDEESLRLQKVKQRGVHAFAGRGRLHATFVASRLSDFLFFEPLGTEIPTHRRMRLAGLRGHASLSDRTHLTGALSGTDVHPEYFANQHERDLAWHTRQGSAHVALAHARGTWHAVVGGRGTLQTFPDAAWRNDAAYVLHGYASVDGQLAPELQQHVSLGWLGTDTAPGWHLLSRTGWRPAPPLALELSLSHARRPAALDAPLWQAHAEGYPLLRGADLSVTLPEALPTATVQAARLAGRLRLADGLHVRAGTFGRRQTGALLPEARYTFQPSTLSAPGSFMVRATEGQVLGLRGGLAWHRSTLDQHLQAVTWRTASGDRTWREAWARTPSLQLTYSATYRPSTRFSLTMQLRHTSSTTWPSYAGLADSSAQALDPYDEHLPGQTALNITAVKQFWGDRLLAVLSIRNALNRPLRYHPLGLEQRMTLSARIRIRLSM